MATKRGNSKKTEGASPHWTEALVLLEITEDNLAKAPKITHVLKAANMLDNVWDYLEGSGKAPARQILEMRDRLNMAQRKNLPFEAYCVAANVRPQDALALLTVEVFDQASKASALLAASQHPAVTEATIIAALSPLGTAEKKMLHQHAGFLPVSKNTIVNVRGDGTVIGGEQKNVMLRPVEESIRSLGDRFMESKLLPQAIDVEPLTVDDDD